MVSLQGRPFYRYGMELVESFRVRVPTTTGSKRGRDLQDDVTLYFVCVVRDTSIFRVTLDRLPGQRYRALHSS
jgi:hypothetical protein